MIGNAAGPPRLDRDPWRRPGSLRMWSWHVAVPRSGPWARPLIIMAHEPQMPSRQSWSNAIGSSPFGDELLVQDVEHLEERHVRADVVELVGPRRPPGASGRPAATPAAGAHASCPPSLVAPLRELDVLELERLLVQRLGSGPPRCTPRPRRRRTRRRCGAPRPPRSGARRGSGRRSSPRGAGRRGTCSSANSRKSATRPAFSSDWLSVSFSPSTRTSA